MWRGFRRQQNVARATLLLRAKRKKKKVEAAGKGDLSYSRISKRGTNRDGNVKRKGGWVTHEAGDGGDGDLEISKRTQLKRAGTLRVCCGVCQGAWLWQAVGLCSVLLRML